MLPMPEPAKPIFPGCAFASAISSCTDFTGSEGCTTSTLGPSAIRLTGSKSFTGSYGTLLVQARIGDEARAGEQQRRSVVRRLRRDLGADVAVGAAAVLDDERLAKALAEFLREDAARRVDAASRRKGQDHAHRAFRISLRGAGLRRGRQRSEQNVIVASRDAPKIVS